MSKVRCQRSERPAPVSDRGTKMRHHVTADVPAEDLLHQAVALTQLLDACSAASMPSRRRRVIVTAFESVVRRSSTSRELHQEVEGAAHRSRARMFKMSP